MRTIILLFAMASLITLSSLSFAASRSMCPEKTFDTTTVEGVYLGNSCGDMCYTTIKLKNGEEFTFICGEEESEKYFKKKGNMVSVTVELQQFWNEYVGECDRQQVFKSGKILQSASQNNSSFDECIDKANGVTDEMLACINVEYAKWDKILNVNYKKTYKLLDNDKDRAILKSAQLAWIAWKDKMFSAILLLEGGGSLARLSANQFIMEETKRQAERLSPTE